MGADVDNQITPEERDNFRAVMSLLLEWDAEKKARFLVKATSDVE